MLVATVVVKIFLIIILDTRGKAQFEPLHKILLLETGIAM
jgi:hypothetical protein